jgi:hypothetical protein
MARAARAGFCIGVLTGSGTVDQLLDSGAHLILPDVGYVPSLLKSFQQQQQQKQVLLQGKLVCKYSLALDCQTVKASPDKL